MIVDRTKKILGLLFRRITHLPLKVRTIHTSVSFVRVYVHSYACCSPLSVHPSIYMSLERACRCAYPYTLWDRGLPQHRYARSTPNHSRTSSNRHSGINSTVYHWFIFLTWNYYQPLLSLWQVPMNFQYPNMLTPSISLNTSSLAVFVWFIPSVVPRAYIVKI